MILRLSKSAKHFSGTAREFFALDRSNVDDGLDLAVRSVRMPEVHASMYDIV